MSQHTIQKRNCHKTIKESLQNYKANVFASHTIEKENKADKAARCFANKNREQNQNITLEKIKKLKYIKQGSECILNREVAA